MNTQTPQPKKPLKDTLFERIETEKVCPHSRLFFRSRECFVWFFWFISVLVGALAVAVSAFVMWHHQYALYEATHENFFTFLVEALPYLWIIAFGVMVYVAVYNLRHTKHGYRYPLWMIMVSSIVLSFAGGSALQLFGFGHEIDEMLGQHMDMYMSQEKYEQKLWQEPKEGRLLGRQIYSTLAPTTTIIFEDAAGQRWTMNITELPPLDVKMLASEKRVRLLGKALNEAPFIFHACGAFPWMMDKGVTAEDMYKQRQAFIERVYEHAHKNTETRMVLEGEEFETAVLPKESICAKIAAVRRMPRVLE